MMVNDDSILGGEGLMVGNVSLLCGGKRWHMDKLLMERTRLEQVGL